MFGKWLDRSTWTPATLAAEIGTAPSVIYAYRAGQKIPGAAMIGRIADASGLSNWSREDFAVGDLPD